MVTRKGAQKITRKSRQKRGAENILPLPLREGVRGKGAVRICQLPPPPNPLPQGEGECGAEVSTRPPPNPWCRDVRRPDHRRGGRGPDRRCVQLEAGLVALPRHHLAMFSAGLLICCTSSSCSRTSSHPEPRADRRPPGVHPGADTALVRRWLEPLGSGDRRQAQSGDAADGMDDRSAKEGAA